MTDGYQVYHKLEKEREDLKVAGCWIHARRPFADFIKSVGLTAAKGSIAQEAYDMITEMLRIDICLYLIARSIVSLFSLRKLMLISHG